MIPEWDCDEIRLKPVGGKVSSVFTVHNSVFTFNFCYWFAICRLVWCELFSPKRLRNKHKFFCCSGLHRLLEQTDFSSRFFLFSFIFHKFLTFNLNHSSEIKVKLIGSSVDDLYAHLWKYEMIFKQTISTVTFCANNFVDSIQILSSDSIKLMNDDSKCSLLIFDLESDGH